MHSEGFPGPLLYLSTIDCNYQISASSQKLKHKPISRRCVFQGHQQQQAPSDHVLLECNPIRACSQCTEFPLSCPFSLPLLEFYSLGGGGRSPIDSLSNALHRSRSTDTGRVRQDSCRPSIFSAYMYFPDSPVRIGSRLHGFGRSSLLTLANVNNRTGNSHNRIIYGWSTDVDVIYPFKQMTRA